MRRGTKPSKAKVESEHPAAATSRESEGPRGRDLEKRLAEAQEQLQMRDRQLTESLEQQTATAEILRVISSSPTDVQPVFAAVAESSARLCDAYDCEIYRVDGDVLRLVAHHGPSPSGPVGQFVVPMVRGTIGGRSVLERRTIHVPDFGADAEEFPVGYALAAGREHRTQLRVPLLREGTALGVIGVRRSEVRPFTEGQIALLQTFADQAVMAIENVRLFTELEARNAELASTVAHHTAADEVLRAISRVQTDAQPVFDIIAESAQRLCGAGYGQVALYDGALLHMTAFHNVNPEGVDALRRRFPAPADGGSAMGRALQTRAVVQIPDVLEDPAYAFKGELQTMGFRSLLVVPMLRQDEPIGAIAVGRREHGAFPNEQIALLKTFADQAVIAIENVRLFKELEARNKDLTESLEQQTATSEILRVISSSPTDLAPVFETILANASRLSGANLAALWRFDGEHIIGAAHYNASPEFARRIMREPLKPGRQGPARQAALERRVVHVADMTIEPGYSPVLLQFERARTVLAVALLREDTLVGVMAMWRREVQPFTEQQIALVQTFANQAVIAIENVRLFTELQASNRELTSALDTQTATSDILRVISRSQTDVQPVFDAILSSALRLMGADAGVLTRVTGGSLDLAAFKSTDNAGEPPSVRAAFPRSLRSGGSHAKAVRDRAPVNIAEAQVDPELPESARTIARDVGYQSMVVVPMVHDDVAIGTISATRREPGGFTDDEITLLKTFADQAVIAIENVRLFRELEARTAALTRSVGELRALGAVGQALSSTLDVDVVLDTIVTRANDLIGADGCTIFEYDEVTEQFHLRATRNLEPRLVELARGTPLRKGDQGILGQLPMGRQAVQVPDITVGSYSSPISDALIKAGYRAVVAVPLIREDHLIGALTMNRKTPGEFPAETIELLQTFATQSALAIQNARLFREIEQKSHELEAASRHKSEFLANMSHELRTPLNAVIGFSEVLSERMFGDLNEKQDEYLKDIHASGQHLLSLINDILDLSKIEAGKMELELSDFDLPMTIDNALMLIRERAARRSIALDTAVDERVGQVRADERKIRQVLLNLLSNAIKFTPEGGRIEVGAKPVDESIEVSVTDTGVGIAAEHQEAVFEEFRQVGTADKKVEGTGLGLALSRKFIELHGGRIWVESQVGTGSTFTFTIPVRRGE